MEGLSRYPTEEEIALYVDAPVSDVQDHIPEEISNCRWVPISIIIVRSFCFDCIVI
jgi:hypothetical protein